MVCLLFRSLSNAVHGLCHQPPLEKPFSSPRVLMLVCAFSKDWPLAGCTWDCPIDDIMSPAHSEVVTLPPLLLVIQYFRQHRYLLPCYTIPTSKFKIQSIWENVTPTKSLKLPYSTFKTDEAKVSLGQLQLKVLGHHIQTCVGPAGLWDRHPHPHPTPSPFCLHMCVTCMMSPSPKSDMD